MKNSERYLRSGACWFERQSDRLASTRPIFIAYSAEIISPTLSAHLYCEGKGCERCALWISQCSNAGRGWQDWGAEARDWKRGHVNANACVCARAAQIRSLCHIICCWQSRTSFLLWPPRFQRLLKCLELAKIRRFERRRLDTRIVAQASKCESASPM